MTAKNEAAKKKDQPQIMLINIFFLFGFFIHYVFAVIVFDSPSEPRGSLSVVHLQGFDVLDSVLDCNFRPVGLSDAGQQFSKPFAGVNGIQFNVPEGVARNFFSGSLHLRDDGFQPGTL